MGTLISRALSIVTGGRSSRELSTAAGPGHRCSGMVRRVRRSVGALFLAVMGVGCALSAPTWKGAASGHFDGVKFSSPEGPVRFGGSGAVTSLLKWQTERKPGPPLHRRSKDRPIRATPHPHRATF